MSHQTDLGIATILIGDVREQLATLPDDSVQCVVTSPPYWGLRDYKTGTWVGGDPTCPHTGRQKPRQDTTGAGEGHERFAATRGNQPAKMYAIPVRRRCPCGAERVDAQIGLEETPQEYVQTLIEVFREIRRVLRGDGTVWLNLGDSYQNAKGQSGGVDPKQPARRHGLRPNDVTIDGLKPKDLVGIPWRVAFALQADGWYLRCDNIWAKPNPMPDSTKDRPTRSHEYVFLLTRSKRYYYDANAIREPYAASTLREVRDGYSGTATKDFDGAGAQNASSVKGRIIQGLRDKQAGHGRRAAGFNGRWESGGAVDHGGANRRSVWWISPKPYRGAHFATFPPELVELCLKAGSAAGQLVLDPFAGSGTTGMVAVSLGRYPILIDLNPDYEPMMVERIAKVCT